MSKSRLSDLLPTNVWFFPDAEADFLALDRARQIMVLRALYKIARAPSELGKPLGNQHDRHLTGFRSAYVDRKSIRIVWRVTDGDRVEVAVVAAVLEREGMHAYEVAAKRRQALDAWLKEKIAASRQP